MIAYVTLGSNNIENAELFYSAFLLPLGYQLFKEGNGDLSYCLPKPGEMTPPLPDVYIKTPFNGKPASAGNGQMIAFEVPSQKNVQSFHSSALKMVGRQRENQAFGPPMVRISMSDICAILMAIRLQCFQTTSLNRAAMIALAKKDKRRFFIA